MIDSEQNTTVKQKSQGISIIPLGADDNILMINSEKKSHFAAAHRSDQIGQALRLHQKSNIYHRSTAIPAYRRIKV